MHREWELEDLVECWTLDESDSALVADRSGPIRPGSALALKFFELKARYPRHVGEMPPAVVDSEIVRRDQPRQNRLTDADPAGLSALCRTHVSLDARFRAGHGYPTWT
jgi:hypothetical protein